MPKVTVARNVAERIHTIRELFQLLTSNRRWWAFPAFALIIVLGLVLAGLHAIPYVAPFIYTVF
jgi:Family of unknown function (DUF5989)